MTTLLTDSATSVNPRQHQCVHEPVCPNADATDRDAAHVISAHPEQGWSLLCNGVVAFEDFGDLLPNGKAVDAHHYGG